MQPFRPQSFQFNITVPTGEAFARSIAALALRTLRQGYPAERFPDSGRLLTPDSVVFLDRDRVRAQELAARNPADGLVYQALQHAGVPAEYLQESFELQTDTAGVYYDVLADHPVVYTDAAVLDILSADDKLVRAGKGLLYGEGFLTSCFQLLPRAREVPDEQRARVQALALRRVESYVDAVSSRYAEQVDAILLQQSVATITDLLRSDYARYLLYGAVILVFFQGRQLQFEFELGSQFHLGVLRSLAARVYERFIAAHEAAFLVRYKGDRSEWSLTQHAFKAEQLLRQLGLRGVGAVWEAYVHSELALHYWAAASKKVDPWTYPA